MAASSSALGSVTVALSPRLRDGAFSSDKPFIWTPPRPPRRPSPLASLQQHRLSLFSPSSSRWSHRVGHSCSRLRKTNNTSLLGEPVAHKLCNCISQSKARSLLKTSVTRFLCDTSWFHLSKPKLHNAIVHVPRATVGPDEPHAAGTAWPEIISEKQDLDLLYTGVEGTDLEGFLSSELPSHPKLYRGKLKNGLRYLILPNKVPPNRYISSILDHLER